MTPRGDCARLNSKAFKKEPLAQKEGERRTGMVPKVGKILYATDLSENSAYAFYYAIDFAQKHHATIVILHVVERAPDVRPYIQMQELIKNQEESIKEAVEEIKRRLQSFCTRVEGEMGPPCVELVSKTLVLVGHATEEILNTADKEDCDLLILGTHGKGLLAHTFLGTVSSAVLQRTRKPVFIIPLPSGKSNFDFGKI